MHVLLIGANGFIGAHLTARLLAAGHRVTGGVRATAPFLRRFLAAGSVACDFERDLSPDVWLDRLAGVDAVINCAGVLQAPRGRSSAAVHHFGPAALFDACLRAGVRRVVQISAISADPEAGTDYAVTKHRADQHLRALDLDWVVLRPSLVWAQGAYGGTSLLRGLAALPWATPLVGDGAQRFQPIHVDDLATTVLAALERPDLARRTLDPTGPQTVTLRELLASLRDWLGLPPAVALQVPLSLVRIACRVGDLVGAGPLRSTSLAQIEYGNVGDPKAFADAIGFVPRSFVEGLARSPSQAQDRLHARLYFVRPLLTAVLVVMWLASGAIGLITPDATAAAVAQGLGLPASTAPWLGVATSLLDLLIGVALLRGGGARLWGPAQIVVVLGYTAALTVAAPALWFDPFGALLKNLPVLGAILAWGAMEDRR